MGGSTDFAVKPSDRCPTQLVEGMTADYGPALCLFMTSEAAGTVLIRLLCLGHWLTVAEGELGRGGGGMTPLYTVIPRQLVPDAHV
jgi:hypothetical protein